MDVKVLGSGCGNCRKLYAVVEQGITQTGMPASLTKVEDYQEIMRYGVIATPALVINGKVVVSGRIPDLPEVSIFLTTAAMQEGKARP